MIDMPEQPSDIDDNVATNLREFRERNGLSQGELAQRMTDLGFGFSQATIWKVESKQRPVKVSEAVALGEALGLRSWTYLTQQPEVSRHHADLEAANRKAYQTFETLKAAAAEYLRAQDELSLTVRCAQDASLSPDFQWTSWLDTPGERAVIEARVQHLEEDAIFEQQHEKVAAILATLREYGYEPPQPEDWTTLDEDEPRGRPEYGAKGQSGV
jgi:transcriptional regulator with XRE-family HTH domain